MSHELALLLKCKNWMHHRCYRLAFSDANRIPALVRRIPIERQTFQRHIAIHQLYSKPNPEQRDEHRKEMSQGTKTVDRANRDVLRTVLTSQRENGGIPTRSAEWRVNSSDPAILAFQRYLRSSGRMLRWMGRVERLTAWLHGRAQTVPPNDIPNDLGMMRSRMRAQLERRDETIARIELFLTSDLPYEWSYARWRGRAGDKGVWPFVTWRDYKAASKG